MHFHISVSLSPVAMVLIKHRIDEDTNRAIDVEVAKMRDERSVRREIGIYYGRREKRMMGEVAIVAIRGKGRYRLCGQSGGHRDIGGAECWYRECGRGRWYFPSLLHGRREPREVKE